MFYMHYDKEQNSVNKITIKFQQLYDIITIQKSVIGFKNPNLRKIRNVP